MKRWAQDLSGNSELFQNIHFQFQTWKLVFLVSKKVTEAAFQFPEEEKDFLLSFWEASIVEFHLYYALPLLSVTACEERGLKVIYGLNKKALSANGLKTEGICQTKSDLDFFFFLYPLCLFFLRTAYSVFQSFRLILPIGKKASFSAWVSTESSGEVFKTILKPDQLKKTVFLSHSLNGDSISRISEGGTSFHLSLLLRWLKKISFRSTSFQCEAHRVLIEPQALSQIWLSFIASRWPAYSGFRSTADQVTRELKNREVEAFLIHHERNLRERVWCQEFKKRGIKSVVIQKGLIGVDALWAYRRLADTFWVDSSFTCQILEKIGSGGIFLPMGYSALPKQLPKTTLPPSFTSFKEILFYATQDVSELGPGMKNKINPTSVSIKTREIKFLLSMAHKYQFQILIKPHPAENARFYQDLISEDDPAYVLSPGDSSFNYLEMSSAVVTRWSTVGYEAMAHGIPVFYLNFYHRYPDIACFHESWIPHARHEKEANSLFSSFWLKQKDPQFRKKYQSWAISQGWHFEVSETLSRALHLLTTPPSIDTPQI